MSGKRYLHAALLQAMAVSAFASPYAPVAERMQRMVNEERLGGASIVLVRHGEIVLERHYGSFGPTTRIAIASASKWLSASVLAALVDRGVLSWDDTVGRWLPDAPADKRAIRLRQLFSHTSGISGGEATGCLNDRTGTTLDACVRAILAGPLVYPPGTRFAYGGNSMQVGGRIAEVAGGASFDELFRSSIGAALGLTATDFGFTSTQPGLIDSPNPRIAGGVRTTVADYARLVAMHAQQGVHQGRRVLRAATVAEMQRDQTGGVPVLTSPRASFGYGLGVWRDLVDAEGRAVQVSSQGAFGYSPWVDAETGLGGVIAVYTRLEAVADDVAEIWTLARQIALAEGARPEVPASIVGGYLTGTAGSSQVRDLYARASAADEVFRGWSGDPAVLDDPRGAHARLRHPGRTFALTAEFRRTTPLDPFVEPINGVEVRGVVPPAAKGLVFRFHGRGGSAAGAFTQSESLRYSEYLVAHGYGVVALDSSDRVERQWHPAFSLDNPDVQNVQAVIERLRRQGRIAPDTPIFGQGTSNGGGFVSRVSALLGFRAQEINIASGIEPIISQAAVPTLWVLARRDRTLVPGSIDSAARSRAALLARGIAAELNVLEPTPVYPERFARIRGIGLEDSRQLQARLRQEGWIDAEGWLLQPPDLPASSLEAYLPPALRPYASAIKGQLELAWADHEFSNDYMHRTVHFFDAHLKPNHTGTWSQPDQPGWGLSISHQGEVLFALWYTYAADGRPEWFIIPGARRQPDGSYQVSIVRVTGTPFDRIDGPAADGGTEVGHARLRALAEGRLQFDFSLNGRSGSHVLRRLDFGAVPLCRFTDSSRAMAANRTDTWYDPRQSGWGIHVVEQGETLFLTWYTYGRDRRPLWLVGQLTRQSDGRFVGSLNRPESGTPFDRIEGPATALPVPEVGRATLEFADGNSGWFRYHLDGIEQERRIERFVFDSPVSECQ